MKKTLIPLLAILALAVQTVPPLGAAEPVKKVLVVTTTTGFRHSSIATAEKILAQLAQQSGAFTLDYVRQPEGKPGGPRKPTALKADASAAEQQAFKAAEEKFTRDQAAYEVADAKWRETLQQALQKLSPDSLKNYDGVIFANTTGDLPIPDREGFLNWIKAGGAFIGMHSCGDTYHGWPAFIEMLGGEFRGHGAQVGVECLNLDQLHPATQKLGRSWVIPLEEIYLFKNYDAAKVHDLLALDKHPNDKTPGHYPVAWSKNYGKGRVFYTSLGHREDIWDADPTMKNRKNPVEVSQAFQTHILGGINWALGLGQVKAK
jgi:type 1 glutamine amidotransferase